jgi:hypothetical protein
MVDLETLGTAPGSVIISIGAVAFAEGMPEHQWNLFDAKPIKVRSSRQVSLTIDEGTLAWWMHQSDEARGLLDCALGSAGGLTIHQALGEFIDWFPTGACLWGNGSDFDNVLLKAAYDAVELAIPWRYSGNRCFRTVKNVFRQVPPPEFSGLRHDALADALHQTRHLQAIFAHVCEAETALKYATAATQEPS